METIIARLKKIQALAESGVEGERANAKRLLEELCAKHGVTIDALTAPELIWCSFRFEGDFERRLLIQCAVFVVGSKNIRNGRPRRRTNEWSFELTRAQEIDLRDAFAHYRAAWRKHLDDVLPAFVHANRIYCPKEESSDEHELTNEERARLRRLASMALMTPRSQWNRGLRLTE